MSSSTPSLRPSPRIITTPRSTSPNSPIVPGSNNTAFASSSSTSPNVQSSRHKSRGSFASPVEVLSRSPNARRMSRSVYSQSGTMLPDGPMNVKRLWDHPIILAGTLLTTVMLCGIVYSLIFHTSLDTSLPSSFLTRDRPGAPYLARKSNILNRLFVKYCWGWTSLAFISHLISSPPSASSSRFTRLIAFGAGTATWLVFTTWFFGAGLGDRVIALSGGHCAITVPSEWGVNPDTLRHLWSDITDSVPTSSSSSSSSLLGSDGGPFLLPLPSSFCSSKLALTPSTHPTLFKALKGSMDSTLLSRTRIPQPRWHKGFDISGHAFLLTLATLLLVRELAPSWRSLLRTRRTIHTTITPLSIGRGGSVHLASISFGTALTTLWTVMLGTTAVYFHNPQEKLSGLALGLGFSALIHALTPESSSLLSSLPQTIGTIHEDENSARRGKIVDDGEVVNQDVVKALEHP
ncbi:inositol phospholipid synthesis and fat-storage-inducing TM-domain-containing protein [Kockovaella imperatae]|uniref:Inositol phospholipid synthesis and fat-storage-inducing TM-domain-containing protein n=1 Tax=Kockovaella imperatae TaxID=4999 RepID=A0A1Y1UR92_9TREE|nr:inositol phospholipid synthesis and fat-storage-inducing TM-domain-containing protein [Kockovaella imperatae]ORX40499.1 inositol phospholipid synthesis and fat-storage-inducing TM-domain-containing protein [Kockovaella imperatae]